MHSPRHSLHAFWPPIILILLVCLALRLAGSMRLPLFLDEALHLDRAHAAMQGEFFSWNARKWLYPVFLSIMRPGGPEGPWLARALSAQMGVVSAACCIALGRQIGSERTGRIAGILYTALPLAVFHERQALADPLLAMLTTLAVLSSSQAARRPSPLPPLIAAFALAAAVLTKLSALPFLSLPLLAALILPVRLRWSAVSRGILIAATALLVITLTYGVIIRESGGQSTPIALLISKTLELTPASSTAAETAPAANRLIASVHFAVELAPWYVGWGTLALIVFGVIGAWRTPQRLAVLYLLVPGVFFAAGPILASRPVDASRYFLPNVSALVILAAVGWTTGAEMLSGWGSRIRRIAKWSVPAVTLAPALVLDALLIMQPSSAPLTRVDRSQYFANTPSGTGYHEIAFALVKDIRDEPGQPIGVLSAGPVIWLKAYLGPRQAAISPLRADREGWRIALAEWLGQGREVFLVISPDDLGYLTEVEPGLELAAVAHHEDSFRSLELLRIVAVQGPLADRIYSYRGDPISAQADITSLTNALQLAGSTALVFPAAVAESLEQTGKAPVHPLTVEEWPLTEQGAERAVERALAATGEEGQISVVLVDETAVDPERLILLMLEQRLYRIGEAWFGLAHHIRYATGPQRPETRPLRIEFEGGIELMQAAILDTATNPGAPVRLMMEWQTPVPIQDSFKVFVHLVDSNGTIIAQHDSVPAAGLMPMTVWEPGQPVLDRFAILIPADAAPGVYEIRAGVYEPTSGLRLPITTPAQAGGDFAVIGTIAVESP